MCPGNGWGGVEKGQCRNYDLSNAGLFSRYSLVKKNLEEKGGSRSQSGMTVHTESNSTQNCFVQYSGAPGGYIALWGTYKQGVPQPYWCRREVSRTKKIPGEIAGYLPIPSHWK